MVVKEKKQFIKEIELVRKEVAGPKQEKAEREQASEALQESEEEYRSLVENSVDGIVIVRGRKIVFANKVVKETSGYSEEELKKLDFIKLIAPSYRSVILKRYLARLAGLPVKNQFEIEVLTKEGRIIPCEISSSVVTYQGNKAIQAMLRDITERKRAEEAVRESEKRCRTLFESKLDGVFVMDAETMRVVLANQAAAEMYGFSSVEEVIGVNPLDFVAPEEKERTLKIIAKDMFEKDRQEINEFRTITKDGKEKWISAVRASIEYEGKLAGLVSFRDITEQKQAEEALRDSEQRTKAMLEAIGDHMSMMDKDLNIVWANEVAKRIFGDDIVGKKCYATYHGRTKPCEPYPCLTLKAFQDGKVHEHDTQVIDKNGKIVNFHCTANVALRDRDGKPAAVIEISRDITERKRVGEGLRKAEEDWRSSFNALEDVMLIIDKDYNVEKINDQGLALLNKSRQEVIGQKCYKIISGADGPPENCPCRQSLKTRKVESVDRYEERFGKYFSIKSCPVFDENGEVVRFVDLRRDITEQKRAEEEIKYQRKYFQSLFESSPEAVVSLESQNRIVDINPAFEKMFGYKLEDIKGRNIDDCVVPRSRKEEGKSLGRRALAGEVVAAESVRRRADGREIPVSILTAPIILDGKQIGTFAIYRNITERKSREEQLIRLSNAVKMSTDSIVITDLEGKIIEANEATLKMYGTDDKEDLIGKNSFDLIAPEEREIAFAGMEEVREGRHIQDREYHIITKDGTRIPVAMSVAIMKDVDGKAVGFVSVSRDISERKKAVEEIKHQRKYFQALFESSSEAVASLDAQNRVAGINPAFEKIFGYTSEDIKGKDIDDCIVPRSRKEEGRSFSRRAYGGEVVVAESIRKRADGREIPVSILTTPITINGKREGMFAIYRDITERKKSEERLERSFVNLAETVSRAMASRDPYTAGHQRRVAELARLVGEKMGLDKDRLQGLYIGGLLHDIGKVSTPEVILSKPGELAEEEWNLIHAHAKQGYRILKDTDLPWPVADMALHHHERLDGSGYPHGISGDKLSLEVRILGVCDVVEAMSSYRPCRPARSVAEILKEIKGGRGTKYDVDVVDIMLEIIESGEFEMGGEAEERTVSVS